jgi:hypothetical protein
MDASTIPTRVGRVAALADLPGGVHYPLMVGVRTLRQSVDGAARTNVNSNTRGWDALRLAECLEAKQNLMERR